MTFVLFSTKAASACVLADAHIPPHRPGALIPGPQRKGALVSELVAGLIE